MFRPIIFEALKTYTRQKFIADLAAGLTVGVVALPLAMAFAIACDFPPEKGLVTAIVAGFLIALLGGSKLQISGPTGAFIVIIVSITATHGYGGLLTATLLAGIFLIAMGLMQFGALIKFIPLPVITGFTSGIAVVIFLTQLRDILGLPQPLPPELFHKLSSLARQFTAANLSALLLCLSTTTLIVFCRRFFPRMPAMLVGMLAATAVATIFKLNVETIGGRFGALAAELPTISIAEIRWNDALTLISPALTIALLAAIESLLSATVADGMTGETHRPNTELIAQGIGNIGAVLCGGIPATGGIARTATNVKCGGQTPISGIIHALTLLLIMLLCAPYAALVPLPALAGIMLVVCFNMSEYRTFWRMFKGPKSDYLVMLLTFLLTVTVDLVVAVEVGVVLSALLFIRRVAEFVEVKALIGDWQETAVVAPQDDPDSLVNKTVPAGVTVYELDGPLFYGAVERFKGNIFAMLRRAEHTRVLILRMRKVSTVDASALNVLDDFVTQCAKRQLSLVFSGVRAQPRAALKKYGITDKVGTNNVCDHIDAALQRAGEILTSMQTVFTPK